MYAIPGEKTMKKDTRWLVPKIGSNEPQNVKEKFTWFLKSMEEDGTDFLGLSCDLVLDDEDQDDGRV